MPESVRTLGFMLLVSALASVVVAGSAMLLRDRQEENRLLYRRVHVLEAAGIVEPGARPGLGEVMRLFDERIEVRVVELASGREAPSIDPVDVDVGPDVRDPGARVPAAANDAGIQSVPRHTIVYRAIEGGELRALILPIEGPGLWGAMYGFIALSPDLVTVRGITFYEHSETPGLGSEISEPGWRRLWVGRRPFDEAGAPVIEVVRGAAGSPEQAPHQVDGISGATITGRAVTNVVRFWLGEGGFGPYLRAYRLEGGAA